MNELRSHFGLDVPFVPFLCISVFCSCAEKWNIRKQCLCHFNVVSILYLIYSVECKMWESSRWMDLRVAIYTCNVSQNANVLFILSFQTNRLLVGLLFIHAIHNCIRNDWVVVCCSTACRHHYRVFQIINAMKYKKNINISSRNILLTNSTSMIRRTKTKKKFNKQTECFIKVAKCKYNILKLRKAHTKNIWLQWTIRKKKINYAKKC